MPSCGTFGGAVNAASSAVSLAAATSAPAIAAIVLSYASLSFLSLCAILV